MIVAAVTEAAADSACGFRVSLVFDVTADPVAVTSGVLASGSGSGFGLAPVLDSGFGPVEVSGSATAVLMRELSSCGLGSQYG